ncbi:MAG: thioredoxin domain-containing protein [Anaerolineae bacterium]|nr:thioredoxin domain-containing protein [Anaerolineae bacterium]
MAEHTPEPIPTPREDAPISLRSDTYPPVTPPRNGGGSQTLTLILTAAVFLLAGLLLATLLSGGDEAMTRADIDALVDRSVGTQVAALGLMPGDPDEARASLQEMVNSAVATQVSGSAPVAPSGGDNESLTRADIAALVDQSVGTQVAALVPTNTPIPPTPTPVPIADTADDDAFRGPQDAPVTIVEFSDFQCGYCGRFYEQTLPQILEKYPDQVRFVYRDFPIFGDDSVRAAMAAECAADQDMFWEMHNRIFDIHKAESAPTLSQETLVSFAQEIGITDTAAFETCLAEEQYLDEIIADFQTAQVYGFRGTPGFVINGVIYSFGAQPFEVFDAIIQQELSAQS